MTGGADNDLPPQSSHDEPHLQDGGRIEGSHRPRMPLAVLGCVLFVAVLVPPLSTEARRVEVFEAVQFALLAIGIPALVVLGAPWRRLGLAARGAMATDTEGVVVLEHPAVADRAAARRRRHPEMLRSVAFLIVETAVVVAWRVPSSVDALSRHGWLVLVEAITLVGAGIGLWLELVESPPFMPRLTRPRRIALAAVAMWTIWVTAYLVGLAHGSVYRVYPHVAGRDLSVSADQTLTTGVLWFASLCAFFPVIFSEPRALAAQ